MTSNWKQQEKELRSDLDDATKDATELMRLHEVAKQATGAGTKQALEQAIARNDDLQRKIDTYVEKIKDIHDQINQAEQQVAELLVAEARREGRVQAVVVAAHAA